MPESRRPPADGQQHEEAPIALVAGTRTGTFATVHEQRAILVHLPFPTPATLGYGYFHHEGKTPRGAGLFQV